MGVTTDLVGKTVRCRELALEGPVRAVTASSCGTRLYLWVEHSTGGLQQIYASRVEFVEVEP